MVGKAGAASTSSTAVSERRWVEVRIELVGAKALADARRVERRKSFIIYLEGVEGRWGLDTGI